jgi:tRNA pseudouridine38/39 synthase
LSSEVELGGQKHSDVSKIRQIFKNLLSSTPNGEAIKEPNDLLLKDILKYHENGAKKLADLKNFTVDVHPDHKETRCFFAVKEDGTKEDFSVVKCVNNLLEREGKPFE